MNQVGFSVTVKSDPKIYINDLSFFVVVVEVKKQSKLPVFIGSGMTVRNLSNFLQADGFIVGSYFKKDGDWRNSLDSTKVKAFIEQIHCVKRR